MFAWKLHWVETSPYTYRFRNTEFFPNTNDTNIIIGIVVLLDTNNTTMPIL